jgi:uncharacterized protein (DUF169 family)
MTSNAHWESLRTLNLSREPVALGFLDAPPPGLERISRTAAAGCAYWRLAADGQTFYTTPDEHQHCVIGAYTHGVSLGPEKAEELQSLIGTMIQLRYLGSDDVQRLPHRPAPMQIAAYAPASRATFAADLVIFSGNARQIMLLSEAARAAGAFAGGTMLGRPACAMVPHSLSERAAVASIGCIGNRVYTALPDEELYLTVPASTLDAMLEQLGVITAANSTLEAYHRRRATELSSQ